jgi:hypothetical protein
MVENPVVAPRFRPIYTYVTVFLSKFSCTDMAIIFKRLNASDSARFLHFDRSCDILT